MYFPWLLPRLLCEIYGVGLLLSLLQNNKCNNNNKKGAMWLGGGQQKSFFLVGQKRMEKFLYIRMLFPSKI
jgi:hypothetical protein